jgi:DNA-directed RNA polymerase subunit RPC12/RpoP
MALIDCPECGHKVSTVAVACPECGYPVKARPATAKPPKPAEPPSQVPSKPAEPVVAGDHPPTPSGKPGTWWQKKPHIFDPHSFDKSDAPAKPVKVGSVRRRIVALLIGGGVFLLLHFELLPRDVQLRWLLSLFGAAMTALVITKWPSRSAEQ